MEGIPRLNENSTENTEQVKLCRFFYVNNDLPGRPIIFECEADTIVEADKLFEEKFNLNLNEAHHIGCSVLKNTPGKK